MTETLNDRMEFVGHLEELRRRLIICLLAILVTTTAAFIYSSDILKLLLIPSGGLHLKAFNLMDPFFIRWRIALVSGIVVAFPVWAYQLYAFVRPALFPQERKAIFPTLFGAMLLFFFGTLFGYGMLWGMIRMMIHLCPPQVELMPSADNYVSFVLFFMLVCGIVFLFPTVIILLTRLHIMNTTVLRKQRKIAYFLLFVIAELITPVNDPIVAPLIFLIPLVLLYEASIYFARRIEARREREADIPELSDEQ